MHHADKSFGFIYTHEEALETVQTMMEHFQKFESVSESLIKQIDDMQA